MSRWQGTANEEPRDQSARCARLGYEYQGMGLQWGEKSIVGSPLNV
jgi:hypothetical protein